MIQRQLNPVNRLKWIFVLIMVCITVPIAACGTGTDSGVTSPLPFSVKGSYFEVQGHTTGYLPGETYQFDMAIRNDTDADWKSSYHIFLVDQNGPVLDIANRTFELHSKGDQENFVVSMALPKDFQEGAYGFTVLFPDKGGTTTTIYIGDSTPDEPVKSWPNVTDYPGTAN